MEVSDALRTYLRRTNQDSSDTQGPKRLSDCSCSCANLPALTATLWDRFAEGTLT